MSDYKGPLDGIRVVDFSWIVAGPQATRILADFGAEVIRVEYEGALDSLRIGGHPASADPNSVNANGTFNNLSRNKLSLMVNTRHPMGLELVKRLIARS